MKKTIRTLILLGIIVVWSLFSITLAQVISSRNSKHNNVPNYYYANYEFADDWDAINERFRKAKARYGINNNFSRSEFVDLYRHFDNVFPHLPNRFSTTYERCLILASNLSNGYSDTDMESLMGNSCYKSLSQAMGTINSSYTVKTTASSNPAGWMAPVTITFDARGSSDPSQETLPVDNFFWYYRDENWVDTPMWQWQIINYTFEESGKFIVHLVARSSNVDEWILDWEQNLTINVTPKAADIVVYANTRRMDKNEKLKIWTTEAEKWVVFDGSLTVPRWWRKIEEHQWIITNNSEVIYDSKWQKWSPKYINRELKWDWEFKVTLTTRDNENNVVSATYSLYVSDPVTVIKQTPAEWTTSTTYNFDGSASYSITKKLDTYFWEVFDANWDDKTNWVKIDYKDGKKMSINFSDKKQRPWNYLVRLTVTDIAWTSNVETREIYVESTPPTPQFIAVPTKIWTYPSEFTLDASSSTDIDVSNWVDSLEYFWSFSSPNDVEILSWENNNEKIVVRFNTKGKHKVTLTVTDQYWQSASISKELKIESTLRPEITAKPWVITRKELMKFESKVNALSIHEYERKFWDWTNNASSWIKNTEHQYDHKWIFDVTLKVTDDEGWNEVKQRVFVWEVGYPILAYKVIDNRWYEIQANDVCRVKSETWVKEELAYSVDRYARFNVNPSISVNTKWISNWLSYAFAVESIMWINNETKVARDWNWSFSQTWCHYIDLTVHDNNVWKDAEERIRFNVKNALPTLKNVTLTFPQYPDDNSMFTFGSTTDTNRAAFDCSGTTNLIIKVTAVDAEDSDGTISRLRFYYYNTDDPSRILEYKNTWINAPYAYFAIPRMWWEYKFWVEVYDNDGWMINSDEYLASNPAIFFPASCNDSDVPTITLTVSSQNIQVWDQVTYTIKSRITSNNEDFATDRTFYYDFTWDGVWDLISKQDTATYTFMEEYEDGVVPRAAVEYRRKLGITDWAKIYVKNGIKPVLLYDSIGNKVIFRDLSVWVFQQRQICFDVAQCNAWNTSYQKTHLVTDIWSLASWIPTDITKNDSFLRTYPEYWTYNVSIYLKNKYGMEVTTWFSITTTDNSNNWLLAPWVNMITIPKTTFSEKVVETNAWKVKDYRAEIFLNEAMNNTLLMYVNSEHGDCYVDTDISTDSDGDRNPENDKNILCNKIAKISYEPNYENTIWRVYFTAKNSETWRDELSYKNFYVTFEWQNWYVLGLDEEKSKIYHDITVLIDWIPDTSNENTELKSYLNILRKNLNNTSEVTALVIDINSLIDGWWIRLDSNQKGLLNSVLSSLSNPDTVTAVSVWMDGYERNKVEILELLTKWSSIREKVEWMFAEFEENISGYTPKEKADAINEIWETILKANKKNKEYDDGILTYYFCNLLNYYDVASSSAKCGGSWESTILDNYQDGATSPWEKNWWLPWRLKIILVILVSWVLIMIWTIVFFSIKARLNSGSEEDEW